MRNYDVVYLTGAPATGKSTLCANIEAARSDVAVFSYSRELRRHVAKRMTGNDLNENDIRRQSSRVVSPADVASVDEKLANLLSESRSKRHIIIDSHAVTKEHYGFRVTPFTPDKLREVAPTLIVVLFTSSEVVRSRISGNNQGRPMPSAFEADFHSHLQAAVAFNYAFQLGCAVHYLNATLDPQTMVAQLSMWLDRN